MFAIQTDLSLFIPRVSSNVSAFEIGHFFEYYDFGKVMRVDLFRHKKYNNAIVYFEYWNKNEMVETFHEKIAEGRARVMYDEPNYWSVYANNRFQSKKTNFTTNERGADLLFAIGGPVKTNKNGMTLLNSIGGIIENLRGVNSGIRYIYRELEDGEIIE